MNIYSVFKKAVFYFLLFYLVCPVQLGLAGYEKDPVKTTQSNTVAVTEELLTREGELQPASPTFKMPDTARFLVKKPYQKMETKQVNQPSEESSSNNWEDEWFSWKGNGQDISKSEAVDKK